mgnify:FL=1
MAIIKPTQAPPTYSTLPMAAFTVGSQAYHDIYVRLGDNHYVKILKQGDIFDESIFKNYREKGVTHFHIHKSNQLHYATELSFGTTKIIRNPSVSFETKVAEVTRQGIVTAEFLKTTPNLGPEEAQFALGYVKNTFTLADEIKAKTEGKNIDSYLKSAAQSEHIVSVTSFSAILARKLGFETEKSAQIIGLAAVFHDVALFQKNPELISMREADMTPEQKQTYYDHPTEGAKILSAIPNIDPTVPQIVANHHRRRDGTGFPKQVDAATPQNMKLAEIVGICEAYFDFVSGFKDDKNFKIKIEMAVFGGFSPEVADQLRPLISIV